MAPAVFDPAGNDRSSRSAPTTPAPVPGWTRLSRNWTRAGATDELSRNVHRARASPGRGGARPGIVELARRPDQAGCGVSQAGAGRPRAQRPAVGLRRAMARAAGQGRASPGCRPEPPAWPSPGQGPGVDVPRRLATGLLTRSGATCPTRHSPVPVPELKAVLLKHRLSGGQRERTRRRSSSTAPWRATVHRCRGHQVPGIGAGTRVLWIEQTAGKTRSRDRPGPLRESLRACSRLSVSACIERRSDGPQRMRGALGGRRQR